MTTYPMPYRGLCHVKVPKAKRKRMAVNSYHSRDPKWGEEEWLQNHYRITSRKRR